MSKVRVGDFVEWHEPIGHCPIDAVGWVTAVDGESITIFWMDLMETKIWEGPLTSKLTIIPQDEIRKHT